MPNGTKKIISQIRFYNSGYCTNNIGRMYKGISSKQIDYQARTILIDYSGRGYILVDTGYSHRVHENGFLSRLYDSLNPITYKTEDSVVYQLLKDGIAPTELKTIILTHLHPDHTGGVYYFPGAELVMSTESKDLIGKSGIRDLIFKNQIGMDLHDHIKTASLNEETPLKNFQGKDLFCDGSIWLIALPGHDALGQLGIYLPEYQLFYVADASWGLKFQNYRMKLILQKIQFDYELYIDTISKLKNLEGLQIISTHGDEVYTNAE